MRIVSNVLQNPENNLPSFHRNSFSKLETTMQENLYEILNNQTSSPSTFTNSQLDLDLKNFNNLENIYVLYANYYLHNSNVVQSNIRISQISQFHHALVRTVKFCCKIHRVSILQRLDENRPLQFLYEYAVRWSAYSNSIWKLSGLLEKVEQRFNESYNQAWPETAHQFKVYRMMTRIWNDEVLTPEMQAHLEIMFKNSIKEYHQDLLQHIRDKTVLKDNIPMEAVLKKFFQALMDCSINEKSVHFINSTDIEFDKFYNSFADILLAETGNFVKTALEVGYKSKNLKVVYGTFEEYSTTVKSFLPSKTQKQFEKTKTEIVVKFIRYIICSRLKQFSTFDFSKIEKKWSPSWEGQLQQVFSVQDSVFMNQFFKVVDEKKFDRTKFKMYWVIMMGKDCDLITKFYDTTLSSYNKF